MTTDEFISTYRKEDVRRLALQAAKFPDVDMPFALDQIAGWQAARRKLPSWAAVDGLIYPPHISMEQCSSEATARYKAPSASPKGERCILEPDEKTPSNGNECILKSDEKTPSNGNECILEPDEKTPDNVNGTLLGPSPLGEWEGAFIDLTGGFGVDFSFLSRGFSRAVYVERQPHLCDVARKNFALLGLDNTEVVCGDGVEYLQTIGHAAMIYLDPARRDSHGGRTYAISDCTPDVLSLLPTLLSKADRVMVKLSPMLDWHETVRSLNAVCPDCVAEVHIVSVCNECKEMLVVMTKHTHAPLTVHCVDLSPLQLPQGGEPSPMKTSEKGISKKKDIQLGRSPKGEGCILKPDEKTPDNGNVTQLGLSPLGELEGALFSFTPSVPSPLGTSSGLSPLGELEGALYEPNASIMKAGCFSQLCERYGVRAVGRNSHLFVSDKAVDDFPGRRFRILATSSMNKKEIKKALSGIDSANIAVRNFPLSVAELRKRLKLKDGGDTYIFATTVGTDKRLLIICKKA